MTPKRLRELFLAWLCKMFYGHDLRNEVEWHTDVLDGRGRCIAFAYCRRCRSTAYCAVSCSEKQLVGEELEDLKKSQREALSEMEIPAIFRWKR